MKRKSDLPNRIKERHRLDDIIINDIRGTYYMSKQLRQMNLITPYQFKMVKTWLMTSTKKAERSYK